jgi:hypothetical protein
MCVDIGSHSQLHPTTTPLHALEVPCRYFFVYVKSSYKSLFVPTRVMVTSHAS